MLAHTRKEIELLRSLGSHTKSDPEWGRINEQLKRFRFREYLAVVILGGVFLLMLKSYDLLLVFLE